jgi:uncharacterized protein (DUF1800 family)
MSRHQIALAFLAAAALGAGTAHARQTPATDAWGPRAAEHLLNRAGFGGRPAEIEYLVQLGRATAVERLIAGSEAAYEEPFFVDAPARPMRAGMGEDEFRKAMDEYRREERELLFQFAGWWVDQMLSGSHPLRERMTLFWHGYFTSSAREVKNATAMVRQNELFRRHALGNFRALLRDVLRDPAMLAYLDNDQNRRANPNENLARELMELFTLGEGNYTEDDVKEAARALTGWTTRDGTKAEFVERAHDPGPKTVLGVKGRHDADGLIDVLLAQPACPRWVAQRLLLYFEGREPGDARVAEYAAALKENRFEIAPVLRKLFLDPAFYAGDVVAERIASPIDYLVGSSRRLGLRPPPQLVWLAAGQLGERLFDPPNVKGWEGGETWITTSTLLARGNMAGMLLGVISLEDVLREEPLELELAIEPSGADASMMDEAPMERAAPPDARPPKPGAARRKIDMGPDLGMMKRLLTTGYSPRIHLTARCERSGARTDAAIVATLADELLGVPLSAESERVLLGFLARERERLRAGDGALLDQGTEVEHVLRQLAHLILSLPEAQLA